jgi:AAA domain
MIPFDEFIEEVQSAVSGLVRHAIASCKETHQRNLAAFTEIQRAYWEQIKKWDKNEITLRTLLQVSEATLRKHLEWIKGLQYLNEHAPESLWVEWKAQFEKRLKDLPASEDVLVHETFWESRPEDAVKVRLWKWARRRRNRFLALDLKIRNGARSFLRRPPLQPPQERRSIAVHPFLENFISLPVARFLLQEREQVLRRVALQLQQLHQETEKMLEEFLGLGKRKDISLASFADGIMARQQEIQAPRLSVDPYSEDMDVFETKAMERIQDRLGRLKGRLQGAWEYAGTFVLPNSRFDEMKILERWASMVDELEKSRKAWEVHFEGHREDWKKDIELSLHQIQTVLICIDTVESLKGKVEGQILPLMKEPGIMIGESLRKFQDANLDEAALKDMILVENRSMLRSLRRHTLPSLTDAVLQAQIDKTMDNYLSRIKHSTEGLQNQHILLLEPDLNRLRPNSKIMEIPLKDLILEEFFSDLSRRHHALNLDMDQKLHEIMRDVSELDQIVEFNLEAALDLLEGRESQGPMTDARSVVTEGLGRAAHQIDDLVRKNIELVRVSQEALVRMTFEYNGQIQDLADNEKILDLRIRVAKAQAKERVRNYWDRFLQSVKTALPSILRFTASSWRELRTGYLRLRKITGIAPSAERIEDPLARFMAEWRNKMAALPHVYQRLFRIEPLTDERFFEGRAEEMKALKDELDSWRVENYGVIALVGEKGSGRTTLLNFATRQFYGKWPCLRMNLKEMNLRTEKGLFMALKDIFKADHIESLDALEGYINEQSDRKILIVEDLQNLFLRTVDGFDILERLLLFVSRTYKQVYWVVTCSLYSWQYFNKVIQISKYFKRTVYLGHLSKEEIESITLKRHRVSGYRLYFEIPERLMMTRKFRKQSSDRELQEYCRELLFERLHELGAGNITVTLLFWLSAIQRIEKDMLVLSPVIDIDFAGLYGFSTDELFTLSALLQHEALNPEEHAAIFHQEVRQSLLLLNRMSNKGILAGPTEGSYKVNPLLYRPVVQYLKARNILH